MGIVSGAVSARHYQVEGTLRLTEVDKFEPQLKKFAFKPVNIAVGEMESFGWVNPLEILDNEVTMDKCSFEDHVVLCLRIDRFSFNKRILKARIQHEIEDYSKKKSRPKLSRDERKIIAARTQFEMMKTQAPSSQFYEAAWSVNSQRLYFCASGEKINNIFCELFHNTFDLALTPLFAYIRMNNWIEKSGASADPDSVLPTSFRHAEDSSGL